MKKVNILICILILLFLSVTTSWSATSLCGDANGDSDVSVSDVTFLINYLFRGGSAPQLLMSDVNGDLEITVSDVVYLINYLFKSGAEPACAQVGAIKGEIYLNGYGACCRLGLCVGYYCPDHDSSYCSAMNPYAEVRVRAFAGGEFVEKITTDQNGNFYLRLPEGTYTVKIYPPQYTIDSLTDVTVTNYQEADLGEFRYIQGFVYQQLLVKSNATQERLEEIMEETGNSIIHYDPDHHWHIIEVTEEYHPQEMAEILMTNYPQEISWAEINGYICPAQ